MKRMAENPFKTHFGKQIQKLFRRKPALGSLPESTLSLSALPPLEVILKRIENIPKDSLRFFLPSPLEDEGLLLGREEEMNRLEKALKNWEEGHPASVALVGPQGAGKTSLVNCFLGRHPGDWRILRGSLETRIIGEDLVLAFFNRLFLLDPPAADIRTLIDRVLDGEPRIVVVESAHNILLRILGGRRAAELFLYVVLATRPRHFWLLTCRQLPWNSMDRIFQISRFFSHLVPVKPLPEDTLQDALSLRIEGSGLKPFFFDSEEESLRDPKPGEDRNGEKRQAFFKRVFSNTGRNLYAALYFMLLGCRHEADSLSILFWPPERLDVGFLKEMDHLTLLSLAEMAGHGALTVSEHEGIFRTDGVRSRTVFEYLEQAGLIVPDPFGGDGHERSFEISPVIHDHVTAVLEQLNLLY